MSKRCLVLGGSGELGGVICQTLIREDCQVAYTYHPREVAPASPLAFACDLRDYDGVERAVQGAAAALGGLDALVQAAGVSGEASFYRSVSAADYDRLQPVDQEAFDECMEINGRGSFAACRAAAPFLKHGGGNILLLASIDGIKPVPSPVHFAASQAAIKGIAESLAKELGHHQVCVNVLAVGILEGGLGSKLGPQLKEAYLTHCALKRFGTMQEVAEMVAWMVTENTYVTGQAIILDGGL